jgi:hypothetical protein
MTECNHDDVAAADDVLQMMYWLRGERLAAAADVPMLERLSGLDPEEVQRALQTGRPAMIPTADRNTASLGQ